jgi:uncharacterized protein (DUF2062 family)
MLRCAVSFVVAAYAKVRLTPHDSHALPAELFTKPSNLDDYPNFFASSSDMIIKKRLHDFYGRFLSLRGEPRAIAMGLAIGVFIGVTPTIPFHTVLIILFGLLFKHNLTAAYLGSWLISNPLTIPILYFSQYELGRYLLGMTHAQLVLTDYSLQAILSTGWHILLPLLTGGIVTAPFFAIPAYFMAYRMVLALRNKNQS